MVEDRLFVPLKAEPFEWFRVGRKRYELRKERGQFVPGKLRTDIKAEVSRGYSGPRLAGRVGKIVRGKDLDEIFDKIDFRLIIPPATSRESAIAFAARFVGSVGPFVAFEVIIEEHHGAS